ncbi:hypothetical protein CGCF415_v006152 [Colletotrichum fructicola]|nr:hypothetical protein CGCF415_v006152 [Colletotrichum fructicola]KAF4937869.1 hypothetical protein CGCF245_v005153 [Colletotrichum fructicola]
MANLIDDGEDFSNNLASDIAPLLALFGEQVTMQFLRAAEICEFICIYRRDPGKRCINSARIMDIQQAMIEPCLLKKSSQQPHGVMQRLPCWLDNALTFARHWFKDAWEKSNCYCDLESANGDDPGFEMEWFILSLRNIEDAIWLPKVPPRTQLLDYIRGIFFRENRKLAAPAKPINEENTTWVILSGTTECLSWTNTESNAQSEASADLESTEDKRNATDPSKLRSQDQKPQRAYTKIEDLSSAQGVLDLRRSLGELGHWKGPAYAEALKGLTGSTAAFGLSKS